VAIFRDRWWLGWGPDTFGLIFPAYQTPQLWMYEWNTWPVHAHNLLLQTAATWGIGALVLLALIGVEVLRRAGHLMGEAGSGDLARQRAWLAALGGVFVASLFGSPTVTGVMLMLFAVAEIAGEPRDVTITRENGLVIAVMAVVLMAGAALGVRQYQASRLARQAMLLREVDAVEAVDASRRAIGLGLGDEFLQRNHLETLLFALQRANSDEPREEAQRVGRDLVRRNPRRAQDHQRLGTALLASVLAGDSSVVGEMREEFARAAELAPWNGLYVSERARALRIAGFTDEAFDLLQPMAEHYRQRGCLWSELAEIEAARGHREAAIRLFRRALAMEWDPQSRTRGRTIARLLVLEAEKEDNGTGTEP